MFTSRAAPLLFGIVLLAWLPLAAAQASYLGASVSLTNDYPAPTPLLGVQAGSLVAEQLTFRGGLETDLTDFALAADLLYAFAPPTPTLGGYGGGGLRYAYRLERQLGAIGASFGLYGVLGLEVRTDQIGTFAELQLPLALSLYGAKARAGVNLYF